MPMNRSLYPDNWDEIATAIKDAASWRCQDCDRCCRRPGESLDEFCTRIIGVDEPAILRRLEIQAHPQRFTLTVAHLDHRPENCHPDNLRALCSGCHCRYDLSQMPRKKQLKQERAGQLTLFADSH
jgi:hypothetical protein